MANTVIALKKSATPSAAPSDLANGELAINYADGKLYYKHANGTIAVFSSGGDSFGTVNAAGTLIVADTTGDILTLEAGTGISITGDAINDKITITATGGASSDTVARETANAAYTQANTATTIGQSAFDQANTAATIGSSAFGQANTALTTGQAAFIKANSALANTTGTFEGTLTIKNDLIVTGNVTIDSNTFHVDATNNRVGIKTTVPSYDLEVNGSFAATTKSFVINHPTKPDMKLRYGSLEGPENGVYVRGRLYGQSIIDLPEYWWNLIDEETITVNLTPIGYSQDLWVQSTSSHFIHLNQPAECFFTVFAERKDVDKLLVEF
jgi:hypothetical protein